MNYLFICSRNQWRSRTAETIFKNNGTHQVRSAGTAPSARIKINQKMMNWADIIFVMEKKHSQLLAQKFSNIPKEIVQLDIPDEYQYMDTNLIEILKEGLVGYFDD